MIRLARDPLNRYRAFKGAVAALCAWEAFAILTKRVPTITELGGRYRGVKPVIYVGLGFHFWAGWHDEPPARKPPQ